MGDDMFQRWLLEGRKEALVIFLAMLGSGMQAMENQAKKFFDGDLRGRKKSETFVVDLKQNFLIPFDLFVAVVRKKQSDNSLLDVGKTIDLANKLDFAVVVRGTKSQKTSPHKVFYVQDQEMPKLRDLAGHSTGVESKRHSLKHGESTRFISETRNTPLNFDDIRKKLAQTSSVTTASKTGDKTKKNTKKQQPTHQESKREDSSNLETGIEEVYSPTEPSLHTRSLPGSVQNSPKSWILRKKSGIHVEDGESLFEEAGTGK